jgi:hypothetical protein
MPWIKLQPHILLVVILKFLEAISNLLAHPQISRYDVMVNTSDMINLPSCLNRYICFYIESELGFEKFIRVTKL